MLKGRERVWGVSSNTFIIQRIFVKKKRGGKKMSKKTAGIVALIAGIVILGLFLLTDRLGIGVAGFGPVQIAGTIVGAIVIAVGLFLTLKK